MRLKAKCTGKTSSIFRNASVYIYTLLLLTSVIVNVSANDGTDETEYVDAKKSVVIYATGNNDCYLINYEQAVDF